MAAVPCSAGRLPLRATWLSKEFDHVARAHFLGDGIRERDGRQGDLAQSAHSRSTHDALTRWPQLAAALAKLARRMASLALSASFQSCVAVLLSGCLDVLVGLARRN